MKTIDDLLDELLPDVEGEGRSTEERILLALQRARDTREELLAERSTSHTLRYQLREAVRVAEQLTIHAAHEREASGLFDSMHSRALAEGLLLCCEQAGWELEKEDGDYVLAWPPDRIPKEEE